MILILILTYNILGRVRYSLRLWNNTPRFDINNSIWVTSQNLYFKENYWLYWYILLYISIILSEQKYIYTIKKMYLVAIHFFLLVFLIIYSIYVFTYVCIHFCHFLYLYFYIENQRINHRLNYLKKFISTLIYVIYVKIIN